MGYSKLYAPIAQCNTQIAVNSNRILSIDAHLGNERVVLKSSLWHNDKTIFGE